MDDLAAFWSARLDDVWFHAREGLGWATGSRYEGQPPAWVAYLRTAGSPEFALAQVDADRAILAAWKEAEARRPGDGAECAHGHAGGVPDGLRIAVKHRVAVFVGHPDYQQAWKP